jgi:hypothetical protein
MAPLKRIWVMTFCLVSIAELLLCYIQLQFVHQCTEGVAVARYWMIQALLFGSHNVLHSVGPLIDSQMTRFLCVVFQTVATASVFRVEVS